MTDRWRHGHSRSPRRPLQAQIQAAREPPIPLEMLYLNLEFQKFLDQNPLSTFTEACNRRRTLVIEWRNLLQSQRDEFANGPIDVDGALRVSNRWGAAVQNYVACGGGRVTDPQNLLAAHPAASQILAADLLPRPSVESLEDCGMQCPFAHRGVRCIRRCILPRGHHHHTGLLRIYICTCSIDPQAAEHDFRPVDAQPRTSTSSGRCRWSSILNRWLE